MATYDDLMVDIGNAPNDDQGDTLRDAFYKINQRFAELRVFLNNRGDWAPNTAYTADPNRDWVIFEGVGYLATSNHTSGATFAADLAAGKWVEADALEAFQAVDELRADLASTATGDGAAMVGFKQAGTGAVDRTVNARLREYQTTGDHATPSQSRAAAGALSSGGFWDTDTPPGRLFRFADRLFVGDAATHAGGQFDQGMERSWVGESAGGYMTYFESRSTAAVFSQIGSVAIAGAARTSDNNRAGELNTIGGAFYAKNDNTNASDKKSAWAIYGHAAHHTNNEFTAAMELDACSMQPVVTLSPYTMGSVGATATSWIGVGGETAQKMVADGTGAALTNVSCAVGIVNTAAEAAGNRYEKGIVFQANALAGWDGANGTAIAMEMARGHQITWKHSGGATAWAGLIRADENNSTTHQRLVFGQGSFQVRGVQSDLTTERPLFSVIAPAMGNAAVNHITLSPGLSGTGVTTVQADGPDTNIDLRLSPKGGGLLRLGNFTGAASSPAGFSADRFLAFKDGSGSVYYIPCKASGW